MHAQQEVTVEEIMEAAGERGEDVKSLADRLYEEGLEEGIEEGVLQSALRLIARGMPVEEASQVLGVPEEKILEFQRETREQRSLFPGVRVPRCEWVAGVWVRRTPVRPGGRKIGVIVKLCGMGIREVEKGRKKAYPDF